MKCPKCGFQNLDKAKFCNECGNKYEISCPNCGTANPAGSKFCYECGHNLTLPSEPIPKDLSFEEKLDKIQRYLPKGLAEKILSQRDKIEGERKQVTVMFCDMEGFTPLTETLGPEEAYGIMDQVYEILIHKVSDYEGTVNEMTGDGIMALFGAPIALEDAPQRAIRSALSIHREMARFNDKIKQEREGIPPLKMRIGIHTGPVVVGTLGNDLRVEFKAVGDTVNLASRMEGLAEPGTTYVTEDTFKLTEGLFRFEALGEKQVKGKEESISVYQVIAPSTRRTRFDVSAERGLTPFVGRERELELLLDGFERAKAGRGQAFSIMSEAGGGKSRLLYEFRKAVTNEDVTFLEGKCLSYSKGVAYHPLIDILKSNFDIREKDGDSDIREKVKNGLKILGADEAFTLPYVLELLSVKDSGIDKIPMSPEERKDRILEALKRIVLKGSEKRPLIMAIEDLHWIDKSSEDSLKNLFDNISGARVLLIFTYRPEFVHTWGGKSYHNQLTLNRLSNRESLVMVTHLLGTEEIDSNLEEVILEKTEGVPFFIEELIKSFKDLKFIERKENKFLLAKDVSDTIIPSTIQDVIMSRVDKLPEGAKDVLQTGSVIEREFSYELIKRVLTLPEQELLAHLSVLKDSELLYERGIYPQTTYVFKHALTQEVAYNSILTKRKRKLHEKIGSSIEELYAKRLEEFYEMLAYHYSKSDNSLKAYQYLKKSGEKATRSFSHWEAFRFCNEAIKVLKKWPETEENDRERIEVILLMTFSMRFLGYPEDSLQILQEGEKLAKDLGDKKSLANFYSRIGVYYSLKGDPRGVEYTEMSFNASQDIQDVELMSVSATSLCFSYLLAGEYPKVTEVARNTINLLDNTRRQAEFFAGAAVNLYSALCGYCGVSLSLLGDFEKGEDLIKRGRRLALKINHLPTLSIIEYCYGYSLSWKGDGKNSKRYFENCISYGEEGQIIMILGLALNGLGYGCYLLEDFKAARNYVERGLKIHLDTGNSFYLSFIYWVLCMIDFQEGDLSNAHTNIKKAVELSQQNNERAIEGGTLIWQGRILGKIDSSQIKKAKEYILNGIKICDDLKLKPDCSQGYLFLGELYADTSQKDLALENLKKAESLFQEMGMDYWLSKTQEVLGRL